jgi:predicted acyltransferase
MNEQLSGQRERIVSVDALRGLAMFMILSTQIGGAPVFKTFAGLFGPGFVEATSGQLTWANQEVSVLNIPQSIFIFVVGLVIPYSLRSRLACTDKRIVVLHVFLRAAILFVLGMIAGGHLLNLDWNKFYFYNNVLEYIAIGYLICALLVLYSSPRVQQAVTAFLLLLVWGIYLFIPAPGGQGDRYSQQMNIGIYLDQLILGPHGHPFKGYWTAALNTIGQTSNMLLGVVIGHVLFSDRSKAQKAKVLLLSGLALWAAGLIWAFVFPSLRSNMTSSYVLQACGISTLLLALFFQLIDIWGYSKWAFFFIVFGANSIAIYMMAHLFKFNLIGDIFVSGLCRFFPPNVGSFIQAVAAMLVMWSIMYYLYCKRTFIKV